MIMGGKIMHLHFQFLVFLFVIALSANSLTLNDRGRRGDYEKWLSWNVENYKAAETSLEAKSYMKGSSRGRRGVVSGEKNVDVKLSNAELKMVKFSVCQDGTCDFLTINEALRSVPFVNTRRVVLSIKPGIYREKVNVPKNMDFITFSGDSNDPPTITGNDTATVAGRDGKPLRTFHSATVAVESNYFVATNIKFENSAPHEVGSRTGQAVALRISGTKAAFYNCSFYGSQDTLYDHRGLHYFSNCFIQGSVDFIFGRARSLYENCTLNSIAKKVASLTAQQRAGSCLDSGFSFKDCTITGSGTIFLGRAWGDYSRVVFSTTYMDKLVLPQGWNDWGQQSRDSKVYYGEYKCSGPGADVTRRVSWARNLTEEEAMPFIGKYYVDGDTWLINP